MVGKPKRLTKRQVELLNLVKLGLSRKIIAARLQIAEATVRNHLVDLRKCLGAHNSAHAVYLGLKEGIIGFDRTGGEGERNMLP